MIPAAEYRRLSLWWDTLPGPVERRPPLTGDVTADVAIAGAGYTGLWTAYYLLGRDPSLRVVLVERETAGFGASGRNGGWCSALFPASVAAVARVSSADRARRLVRALHDTVDEVGRVLAAEGIDAHYAKGGTVTLARTDLQLQRLRDEVAEWRRWGFGPQDYDLLDAAGAHDRLGATDVLGGLVTPHCAAVHPARLVRGLADAVVARGALLVEGTPVTSLEPGVLRTPHGTVRAPIVVRATEGYTAGLPGLRREVAPVYSLMLATEPLPARVWEQIGLARRETFNDARHLIIYGQRTADDRLAFGGRGAPYHFGSRVQPRFDREPAVYVELWRVLTDLLPVVAGHAVTHTWGGPLGVPRDWFASCGLDRTTGLAWAGGYVGDGVGASNLAGRTLADLIQQVDSPLVDLPWVNHRSPRWEPEPLRWLGANAGLRVMSSADGVEARTGRPARRAALFGRLLGH